MTTKGKEDMTCNNANIELVAQLAYPINQSMILES